MMKARKPILVPIVVLLCLYTTVSHSGDDDQLVANVNGRDIRMSDVYGEVESMPLGDQIAVRQRLDAFAESLVREEVLFQSMLLTDFESEPALRKRIKALVVEHLIDRHVRSQLAASEQDIAQFYTNNASAIRGEGVRASQILLSQRSECETLLNAISSAAEFEHMAKSRSLHRESAERGGDIGLFMNHEGPLGFETALFKMQPDDMAVFDSEDGCHLVRVTERDTPPLPPLDNVRDRIRNLLLAKQERRLLKALLDAAHEVVPVQRPAR